MTIVVAWVRRAKDMRELVIASDSQLRSYGAMSQAQKIIPLERGDCALSFCGDAQIAYPLFVQVVTALNNSLKTKSRALDLTQTQDYIGKILNNMIDSWDIDKNEKSDQLERTKVMIAGWSWIMQDFFVGYFKYRNNKFQFHKECMRMPYPYKEKTRSILFIGDYYKEFRDSLCNTLDEKYQRRPGSQIEVDLDYEPIRALSKILNKNLFEDLTGIGGAPQMLKIYPFSSSLPFIIRKSLESHYLFGRKLFPWEKSEYPILDIEQPVAKIHYPKSLIPRPAEI